MQNNVRDALKGRVCSPESLSVGRMVSQKRILALELDWSLAESSLPLSYDFISS